MTSELIEHIKWELKINWKFWWLVLGGLAIILAATYAPMNPDQDLESVGRFSTATLGVSIVIFGFIFRHARAIDRIFERLEELENKSGDSKE